MSLTLLAGCKTGQSDREQPTSVGQAGQHSQSAGSDRAVERTKGDGTNEARGADGAVDLSLDPRALAEIVGQKAQTTEEGVVRFTWPRDDVEVLIDGVPLEPAAGLTSWVAFKPMSDGAMVMGDTVVFQDEANPAMDAAFAHGLEVTALHNHFFFDRPGVYFMHIAGSGSAGELARGVRAVWDAIEEVRRKRAKPADGFSGRPVPEGDIDKERLGEILGLEVSDANGVMKVSAPRTIEMGSIQVAGPMGVSSWAAFSGNDEEAVVDGDVAMTAAEVQPVLRALREHGIYVVALHNHMIGGEPFLYFTHFWGRGSAEELARAFKAALDHLDTAHR